MASPGFILPFNFPLGGPDSPKGDAAPGKTFYGKDLLFINGAVPLTPQGDYATVVEEENLRRAVWRMLITAPGEYRLRPTYGVGVGDFLYKPIISSTVDAMKLRISEQLITDRRIERVISVDVTSEVFGTKTGVRVVVVVQAFGRTLRFQPFNFVKEA